MWLSWMVTFSRFRRRTSRSCARRTSASTSTAGNSGVHPARPKFRHCTVWECILSCGFLGTPEISTAHLWILPQPGRCVLKDDAAGLQHVTGPGDFQSEIRVLLDQQNRDAVLAINLDDFL